MCCNIVARGLRKVYKLHSGDQAHGASLKVAIDDVDFEIREGERVGFIGENGAGKSTLLKMIAGVSQPTSGHLDVRGHVHAVLTLGMGLREDLTGRENLYLDGEVQGKSRSELDAIIDKMIEFVDIGEFIDRPVRTYSSGMKARLTFASLVFVEPEILLIDEALGAGDHKFNAKAAKVIKDLCRRGKIVLIVSHGLASIVELCNRCIWLHEGRIMMDGDPVQVTEAYRKWVRDRDEEDARERFSRDVASHSHDGVSRFTALEVGMASSSRSLLVTAEDAWIRLAWSFSRPHDASDVRIRIERMDGVLVADQTLDESFGDDLLQQHGELYLAMDPLLLRGGYYKLLVSLESGRERSLATRSIVFKVVDTEEFVGGEPVLRTGLRLDVVPFESA